MPVKAEYTNPRQRVQAAIRHEQPDRAPADFQATPEVWERLIAQLEPEAQAIQANDYLESSREAILKHFQIDCRVLSYDMFCNPPEACFNPEARVDWWRTLSRSTPNRMWRLSHPDGTLADIWGIRTRRVQNDFGEYEEFAGHPLQETTSVEALHSYAWPEPDWWDFSPIPGILAALDEGDPFHIRFRIGSVFEIAWQLAGLDHFLSDLALSPRLPLYIMERLTDIYLENTRRVLDLAGDRLDMLYFYDDVASQNSLLISPAMWRKFIRPHHARLVELAQSHGKPVMYHCDGAIYPLLPELIDLGIKVINPIQPGAVGMNPERLKAEFGDRLAFHGGIDIVNTLPHGTPASVSVEVRERVKVLGAGGGYILCSSHHIQADTPVENVIALYQPELRYL